jgi:DNA-damage-inducible protein D
VGCSIAGQKEISNKLVEESPPKRRAFTCALILWNLPRGWLLWYTFRLDFSAQRGHIMDGELTTVFHFNDGQRSFEDLGQPNGATHWREADVRESLGYDSKEGFRRALTRAKQACLTLGLQCEEHFTLQPDGEHLLTRFGCYLVAMNGDTRKPQVAAAQAYFAAIAETFQTHLEHADGIDRILIRSEVTDGHKSLCSTAKAHGVTNYAIFQDQGFLGMYNMCLQKLTRYKGVPDGERLVDRMSKTELAAHLFRLTQTDEKIKRDNIRGQHNVGRTARDVGQKVRKTMMDLSGNAPENLPISEHLKGVTKKLKGTSKKLKSIDRPKRK